MDIISKNKVSFEDMPKLIAMLISKIESLESKFIESEKRFKLMKDKGELLKGYKAISKRYNIGSSEIAKLIVKGAPLMKIGRAYQCYTNEMDAYFESIQPFRQKK
ncbi:MAG: hypothetical protein JNM21_07075 [Taibaiella sp.]|nr:hypothetical protein [Taibaiella sp.]